MQPNVPADTPCRSSSRFRSDVMHSLRTPSSLRALHYEAYIDVPHGSSIRTATHCREVRFLHKVCPAVVGVANIFHCSSVGLPLDMCEMKGATGEHTKYRIAHVSGVHESHFYFPQEKQKEKMFVFFFLVS